MSRPDTWMPLYVADYLADTGRLTTEMHGAYLLLIMEYWRAGEPLPDCDMQLASITRLPEERWEKMRPVIARFFQVADGVWTHKRIDAEMAEASERYAKAKAKSEAAIAAKKARKETKGQTFKDTSKQTLGQTLEQSSEASLGRTQPHSLTRDTDTDVSGAAAPAKTAEQSMWSEGVQWIAQGSVIPLKDARSFVGKLAKHHGAARVWQVMADGMAQVPEIVNPLEWTAKALQSRNRTNVSVASRCGTQADHRTAITEVALALGAVRAAAG